MLRPHDFDFLPWQSHGRSHANPPQKALRRLPRRPEPHSRSWRVADEAVVPLSEIQDDQIIGMLCDLSHK